MAIIGMIDQIVNIGTMIGVLMGRLEEGPQFMIGWGVDSVYTIDLVSVSGIFPETKRNLRKWRMHEFQMNSYFAEMLILIEWNQGKIFVSRLDNHNSHHGVQRG